MELLTQFALFAISTFVLVKSADYFITNVEKLGIFLKLPHFITGVLIVAVGTSLPEFMTSMASVLRSETDMLAGNVLGTVIANIFLGLGFVIFLSRKNIKFEQNVFSVHFPIFIFSVALAVLTIINDHIITPIEGIFFLVTAASYIWFLIAERKFELFHEHVAFSWKLIIIPIFGLIGLAISSEFIVSSVIEIATMLEIGKTSLSATLVAVGTSFPEMVVVYSMLKKKNYDMAVGNILGSNIFDILLIFGVGSIITPLSVSDTTVNVILPFMVASLFVYWGISLDRRISRYEGLVMTFFYILFVGKLFGFV